MKIAMFTDCYFPRVNGVSASVKSYAEAIAKLGHEICIICPDYVEHDRFVDQIFNTFYYDNNASDVANVHTVRIPSMSFFLSKEDRTTRIDQWNKVKKVLKQFGPDVIHLNTEFIMGLMGLSYAKMKKIPCIYTFHTMWEDYFPNYIKMLPSTYSGKLGKEIVKLYLKRADTVVAPTQRIADVVKRYKVDKPVSVLPTGIPSSIANVSEEALEDARNKLNSINPEILNSRILIYIGRVVKEKNLDFLFDVLDKVREKNDKTVLLIVGGGPELESLKEKADCDKYRNNIFFTGYVKRETLGAYYKLSDVFVFPSVTETQGLVTLEAMMTGTPVVAIGEMGTVDVMKGDNGGFMVKNDLQEFSDAVLKLLNDKELYDDKCREALEWSKDWSMDNLSPKMIDIYNRIIEDKKKEL